MCRKFECSTKCCLKKPVDNNVIKVGVRINYEKEDKDKFGVMGRMVQVITLPDRPGSPPVQLKVDTIDASTVQLRWRPPSVPNGKVVEYRVHYAYMDTSNRWNVQPVLIAKETQFNLTRLFSYTR